MTDEAKVPVAPDQVVKDTVEAPLFVNPRKAIEDEVTTQNETFPEAEQPEASPIVDEKVVASKEDELSDDPIERIKKATQKRINQVVAQKKSVEERLAELEEENARLKANPSPATVDKKDSAEAPTIEQVQAYILKMREEGNAKEEIAAQAYLITLVKEQAVKEVEEKQKKAVSEARAKADRENQALLDLAKDYIVYTDKGEADMKSDLTLANQNGLLFKTAMALYNDPDLRAKFYNDADRPMALRRAVQDANRELHAQGLLKTPKAEGFEIRRNPRTVLADPDATEIEEAPTSSSSLLSDAEKVRDEIKQRNKMRTPRRDS